METAGEVTYAHTHTHTHTHTHKHTPQFIFISIQIENCEFTLILQFPVQHKRIHSCSPSFQICTSPLKQWGSWLPLFWNIYLFNQSPLYVIILHLAARYRLTCVPLPPFGTDFLSHWELPFFPSATPTSSSGLPPQLPQGGPSSLHSGSVIPPPRAKPGVWPEGGHRIPLRNALCIIRTLILGHALFQFQYTMTSMCQVLWLVLQNTAQGWARTSLCKIPASWPLSSAISLLRASMLGPFAELGLCICFLFCFVLSSLLEYNCFTMVC